jgi:antitoxin component YwqK of YwqJK toxin-antitoxin module
MKSVQPLISCAAWASLLLVGTLALPAMAQALTPPDTSAAAGLRYYPNGAIQQQIEQSRSRRTERSFYPSGLMQRELIWAMNGAKHVLERDVEFSPSGVMLREKRWAAGEPVTELEFLISGLLVSRKEYTGMGPTRELLVQDYFASGVLASEQHIAQPTHGKPYPIGSQKKFDTSGRPISEQIFDEQGKLIEDKVWNAMGQPVSKLPQSLQ